MCIEHLWCPGPSCLPSYSRGKRIDCPRPSLQFAPELLCYGRMGLPQDSLLSGIGALEVPGCQYPTGQLDPEWQNPGRKYFPPQSLRQIILGRFLHSSSEPPSPVRTPVARRVNHPDNTALCWLPILPCFTLSNPLSFSLFTSQIKLPAHQPSSLVLLFGEPRLRHSENHGIDLTSLFQRWTFKCM